MAEIEKPTRDERRRDRRIVREGRREYRQKIKDIPKDVRQENQRIAKENKQSNRKAERVAKSIAKSDVELKKTAASKFMAENPAVGQTLSQITQGKGFGGYTPPTTTDVDNSTIQTQANSIPTAGMRLTSAVAKDPNATLTDLNKLSEATTAVNNAQNQQDAAIADEAIATNNAVSQVPKAEVPAVGNEVAANEVANAEQGGIPSMAIKPAQTIDNAGTMPTERIGGDGQTLVQQQKGGSATFDQGLNRSKVQDEITKGAFQGLSSSPVLAIEKLGVQDYFPNAGESIAAGSYSGKYIGNTTIFAAPGARVPFGLYDARMRALKDAAAEKQKTIDKILTAPETAAQFQAQFVNDYFFPEVVNPFMEKYGNDPNAIMNDPEFRQAMANAEAKARDTKQVSEWAKGVADSYQKPGVYVPAEMMKDVEKILYATGDDYAAYLRGENTSFGQALKNAKSYQDMMPHIEELMKTVTAPDRLTERPFDFKKGAQYDDPEFVAGRNKFMQQVFDGSAIQGTDAYADGVIKYFDLPDIYGSIRAEFASRNASEEQLPYALKYAAGLIPSESIKFSYHMIKTDELGFAQLAQRNKEFQMQQDEKNMSFAKIIDDGASMGINPKTGKTYNQELVELEKSGLKGPALQKKLEELDGIYLGARQGSKTRIDKNGTIVTEIPLPKIDAKQADPSKVKFKVSYKQPDGSYVKDREMTAAEIARVAPNIKLSIGGQRIENNSDFATIRTAPTSTETRLAFYDKDGNFKYKTAENLAEYNKANGRRVTLATNLDQAYIMKQGTDADGNTYEYAVPISGKIEGTVFNLSNPSGQQMFDDQVGFNTYQAAQVQGGGTTTTVNSATTVAP